MLVRFQEAQAAKDGGFQDFSRLKRPTKIMKISNLEEALKWRHEVVKEIGQKVTQIHDPSLNEYQITELNDELNRLFQENIRWESHIKNKLRGPDLKRRKQLNTTGGTLINGKRYFGRALELKEVQNLLKEQKEQYEKEKSGKEKKREMIKKKKRWENTLKDDYFVGNADESFVRYEESKTNELRARLSMSDKKPLKILPEVEIPKIGDIELWLVNRRKEELQKQLGL